MSDFRTRAFSFLIRHRWWGEFCAGQSGLCGPVPSYPVGHQGRHLMGNPDSQGVTPSAGCRALHCLPVGVLRSS